MKKTAVLCAMVAAGFAAPVAYAGGSAAAGAAAVRLSKHAWGKCDECGGSGWVETWSGTERCRACDGSGKSWNLWVVAGLIGIGAIFFFGSKK